MKKVLGFALCAFLCLGATSAFAGTFFFGFEGAFLQPSGHPNSYAINDPDDDSTPEGTLNRNEFDSEMATEIYFGWEVGTGKYIWIDFWNWDETNVDMVASDDSDPLNPGYLWDILYHADDAFEGYEGTATSALTIDASKIDIAYGRTVIEDGNFSMGWMAGLRSASLDYTHMVEYDDLSDPEMVMLTSETDGFGIVGGMRANIKLNDRWSLHAGSSYSFMDGEVETSTLNYEASDLLIEFPDADFRSSEDRSFTILEANCDLSFKTADWLILHAGLSYSQWNNVVGINLNPDDVHEGFVQSDNEDVNFAGFTVGATFIFGGE